VNSYKMSAPNEPEVPVPAKDNKRRPSAPLRHFSTGSIKFQKDSKSFATVDIDDGEYEEAAAGSASRTSRPPLERGESTIVRNARQSMKAVRQMTINAEEARKDPRSVLKKNSLLLLTLTAVVLAAIIAVLVVSLAEPRYATIDPKNSSNVVKFLFTKRELSYIKFPGELFLRALAMIILPLIVSSIVSGFANLDATSSKRMGGITIAFYGGTTVLAAIEGMISVTVFRPGYFGRTPVMKDLPNDSFVGDEPCVDIEGPVINSADNILDLMRNMIPTNLFEATFDSYSTKAIAHNFTYLKDDFIDCVTDPKGQMVRGTNILGLVVFSAILGMVCSSLQEEAKAISNLFNQLNLCIMKIIEMIMYVSPIGIFFLMLGQVLSTEDMGAQLAKIGFYIVIFLLTLAFHACLVIPVIFFLVTRKNPIKYIGGMVQALVTAFATSSSSATLPVTMTCVEENNKIDKRVTQFVLPIGATINMDGSCIYFTISAIFMAQLDDIPLGIPQVITIAITSALVSIGASGTPNAGMVFFIMILNAAGLPSEKVSLIYAVDWLLDRFITAANVNGDAMGVGIVQHLCYKQLFPDGRPEDEEEKPPNSKNQSATPVDVV